MSYTDAIIEVGAKISRAEGRYGPFKSTHEAMGVALEEWHEFIDAVRGNDMDAIRHEALDLAAVMLRIAESDDAAFLERSKK
jgi:NTP pyrophosphatase (non-canonical NTP hydrolase)